MKGRRGSASVAALFLLAQLTGVNAARAAAGNNGGDDDDKPSPVPSRARRAAKLVSVPDYQVGASETGEAVYFSRKMNGRKAASGELLEGDTLTAAHAVYPFGSILRVTNLANGSAIEVRVIDRISVNSNKVISVSHSAAEQLDFIKMGSAQVKVQLVALGAGR